MLHVKVSIVIDIVMSLGTDRCWHQITDTYWVMTCACTGLTIALMLKDIQGFWGLVYHVLLSEQTNHDSKRKDTCILRAISKKL